MLVKFGSKFTLQGTTKLPLKYNHLPFRPIAMARAGGHQRNVLMLWLLVCLLTIPSAILTTMLDWTGLPVDVAGIRVHLSIYLPLITCIPLVLWMGFWWGAIPAYLSTCAVAYYSGLPIHWIFVFALANPLGLAIYSLVYRVTALRIDLKSLSSIIGFGFVSLLSAITGSTGSFVWGRMVDRGITDTYPIWQGWWLGGWLQAFLIVGPILFLFTQSALKAIDAPLPQNVSLVAWRRKFFLALLVGLTVLINYVVIARTFGLAETYEALQEVQNTAIRHEIMNAVDSLTYPIFVLLGIIFACSYFTYRAISFWSSELVNANLQLAENNKQLEELAATDPLMNIANRRSIMKKLENAIARSTREHSPVTIIMVDADHFKRVNDTYGHTAGDSVLQQLSQRMLEQLRDYDEIGRYGGEEFIIILPNYKIDDAMAIAERLRSCIDATPIITPYGEVKMTISLGLTQLTSEDDTVMAFVDRADQALIESKHKGRNCITVANATSPS